MPARPVAQLPRDEPIRWSHVGGELGSLCAQFTADTLDDFLILMRVAGHPLRALLWMVCGVRVARAWWRRRSVMDEIPAVDTAPWAMRLVQLAYTLYTSRTPLSLSTATVVRVH